MIFVSYFSIASADAGNLPTVEFTPRSKICFMIVVVPIDSFKILTTWEYFFFSILFLFLAVYALSITILRATEGVIIGGLDAGFSLIFFH